MLIYLYMFNKVFLCVSKEKKSLLWYVGFLL